MRRLDAVVTMFSAVGQEVYVVESELPTGPSTGWMAPNTWIPVAVLVLGLVVFFSAQNHRRHS